MAEPSPFVVHVGDLLTRSGDQRRHRLAVPVDWSVDFVAVAPDTPVAADLVLSSAAGGIVVRGTVAATLRTTCVRCLEETDRDVELEVAQLVEKPGAAGDDGYELDGDQIDLEPILRDELMLHMPLRPVCDTDCVELEPTSQSDLNTDTPAAPERPSPFAVLQDLFDPGD